MDFHSLNRRELQSLCKLNKIPANMTNVAMADALKNLNSVEGIEEILNPLRSDTVELSIESSGKVELMSPRVPMSSCRTSTRPKVKKTDVESVPATVSRTTSRGVRRTIGGDVNDLVKTPSVASTRKKVPTTASRQNVLTQLNECEEVEKSNATCNRRKVTIASARQSTVKKEVSVQGVYGTRRSTRLTAKKSAEQGVMEKEQCEPVKISSFLDEVSEKSQGDLSNSYPEKSTGSDSGSIETSHELSVSSNNKEDNILEESAESCVLSVSKEKVEDICSAFEKLDVLVGGQNLIPLHMDATKETIAEKEDCTNEEGTIKVTLIENFEHQEKFEDLDEKYDQVDNLKQESDDMSFECEDMDSTENEKNDQKEALNVSENENSPFVSLEEHSEETSVQEDDLKHDSEIISKIYKDGNSKEEILAIKEKNDQNETLDLSVNEPKAYFALKEQNKKINHLEDVKQDSEVITNVSEDEDSEVISDVSEDEHSEKELSTEDEMDDLSEALNISEKKQIAYLAETDGTDVDAYSSIETPKDPSKLISEDQSGVLDMKIELSECIGSPNTVGDLVNFKTERSSDVSSFNNSDNLSVVEKMTAENTEEDISKYTNSNMDCKAPKEVQDSLADETSVVLNSELNHETEETKAVAVKATNESVADVSLIKETIATDFICNMTSPDIAPPISVMNSISDNDNKSENKLQAVIAEENKIFIAKTADEKSMSIRQLKKQLKALSLKSTNKDDKVVEARPALQAVCENPMVTEELEK